MFTDHPTLISALLVLLGIAVGSGGLAVWFKAGPDRRKTGAETQGLIIEDLNEAYQRVSDDLVQTQMRLKSCEAENENCRRLIQELQAAVASQQRFFLLARARSHLGQNIIGNYDVHNQTVLDVIEEHNKHHPMCGIAITPMMRTARIRQSYLAELERLEAMEAQELEKLLRAGQAKDLPPAE